jgi:hypothetical protein
MIGANGSIGLTCVKQSRCKPGVAISPWDNGERRPE